MPTPYADDQKLDYVRCINLALDYITANLDGDLRLKTVAAAAGFSPFHFHRIFQSAMGETLNDFVKRSRLERAMRLMAHAPTLSLTDVALQCGFSSSSDFSRSFKARYHVAPSQFDVERFRHDRRQEFESAMAAPQAGPTLTKLPPGENPDGFVAQLLELPPRIVAYIRVLNPYQSTGAIDACQRLMAWADQRQLADAQWLGYMWEDPEIVKLENCRYDVAVVIDEGIAKSLPDGEIGVYHIPAMRVADVELKGDIQLVQRGIDWLFGTWLPESGFRPDDHPVFEAWLGRPFANGNEYFETRCQLPLSR